MTDTEFVEKVERFRIQLEYNETQKSWACFQNKKGDGYWYSGKTAKQAVEKMFKGDQSD